MTALHGEGPGHARQLLSRIPRQALGVTTADRLRVAAAIAVAEGDGAVARDALDRALTACPAHASGPRAWLVQLRESLAASARATGPGPGGALSTRSRP